MLRFSARIAPLFIGFIQFLSNSVIILAFRRKLLCQTAVKNHFILCFKTLNVLLLKKLTQFFMELKNRHFIGFIITIFVINFSYSAAYRLIFNLF